MKRNLIIIIAMCLFSFSLMAQTRGVKLDDFRTIWYDSVYSAQKIRSLDLAMKYPTLSIVIVNKSATITDSVKIYSVTKGYRSVRPFEALDYSAAGIWLRNSLGESIQSDAVITLAPNTTKEFVVVNFAIQILEYRLQNTNANAKLYFYTKGVKQSQDRE